VPSTLRCLFYCYAPLRDLPSFPTRRSSDLIYQAVVKRFEQGGSDVLGQLRLSARQYPEPLRSWMLDLTDQVWSMLLQDVQQQIRSEEHTSELQSRENLVCRLLLEKKKKTDS